MHAKDPLKAQNTHWGARFARVSGHMTDFNARTVIEF